jgi:glutamine amidotransferase
MKKLIVVVDYSMGNLRSVAKAGEHVADNKVKILISNKPEDIRDADAIIFPGQGAAKSCMQALNNTGMIHALKDAASEKPFLGICMGLQVLMETSDENNNVDCLGILEGSVQKIELDDNSKLKIPHMGWNQIKQTTEHPLWHSIAQDERFYFVHSYFVVPKNKQLTVGTTTHGQQFSAAIAKDNLFAIQAHPEKSADAGLQLFKNFINWNGQC